MDINIIVRNGRELPGDARLFFGEEKVHFAGPGVDMFDLLKEHGLFLTKGEARRNWKRSGQEIPKGFSHFRRIGKLRHELAILNPR